MKAVRARPVVDAQVIRAWRAPIVVVSLLVLVSLLFFPTLTVLHGKWSYWTGNYSHGYAVVAISAWLLVRAARNAEFGAPMSLLAGGALFLMSALWFLAWAAGILLIQALVLPLVVFLALCCLFGLPSWRQWAFPAAYLFFAMPFWEVFAPALQNLTIAATAGLLDVAGVPAYLEGTYVRLAAGTIEIAMGCAGLHFFVSGSLIFSLYAYLFLKQCRNQVALVAVALLTSIVINWLRVTTIALAGNATDMQHYLVTEDHYVYGWVLFAASMIPVFVFGMWLERRENVPDGGGVARDYSVARVPWTGVALACVALAAGPVGATVITAVTATPDPASFAAPESIGGWQRSAGTGAPLGIRFPGSLAQVEAAYTRTGDARHLYLFANLYGRSRQGGELISSGNRLFDREFWEPVSEATQQVSPDARPASVNVARLQSRNGDEVLLVYWYRVAGRSFAGEAEAKLAEFLAVLGGVSGSGVRVLALECDGRCDETRELLLGILEPEGHLPALALFGDTERGRGSL